MSSQPERPRSLSVSSSGSSSPILSAVDSSSALILVQEPEDNSPLEYNTSDDEDDDEFARQLDVRRASIPHLSPNSVFLYLLVPYIKLGAMFLPNTELPLKYGIPALALFAVLSAFVRQIWYMLARYLRKADMEEVILDSFARGRGKERRRAILRSMVRGGTGTLRVLLATLYLRESVHVLLPLFPEDLMLPLRPVLTVLLALIVILPLSSAQSIASKRVISTAWLSVATYLLWLGCVISARSRGSLEVHPGWLRMGTLWQGITTTAFAFTSSSTLPLYASLKGTTQPITTAKTPRFRSFRLLSTISVSIALLLTLPLVIFSAFQNKPTTLSFPFQGTSKWPLQSFILFLNAATLLLGIPSILISTPSLPIPEHIRRSVNFSISKISVLIVVTLLSLVPAAISYVLSDILLILALTSTYFLPALIHINTHFFKRPLSIIMPQVPGTPGRNTGPHNGSGSPRADELLQRKERALQRKQFRKRIVWDIGVWILLFISGAGLVWVFGILAGKW